MKNDSLRKLLNTTVTDTEIEVEHDGETYLVRGRPDAALLTRCQAMTDVQVRNYCKNLSMSTGRTIDAISFRSILFVKHSLVAPDGEAPYDDSEIAKLMVNHGVLFAKLLDAASKVLGLVDPVAEGDDPYAEVCVKN